MIDRARLVDDLKSLLRELEDDLRERCGEHPDVDASLRRVWQEAKESGRTAEPYETWREGELTQAGAAWILGCVFVRFLEDNSLVPEPLLAGAGPSLVRARERHTDWFRERPAATDRDYLLSVFREIAALPGMAALFDERRNPLFRLGLSADGATKLLAFFQSVDPGTGALAHDFTDPEWSTRFLGDLYQDLSEAARKRYALLQTPLFVEEFILDRTLEPAIAESGFREVRLIDPACGSGHFLLGAFDRLLDRWRKNEPATNPRALAQRALDQVAGVDVNPFAVAIARFRLLLAALQASGISRLADAPGFTIHVAAGDSLLHGARSPDDHLGHQRELHGADPLDHVYETEDKDALRRILAPGHYHAVVGNPPYITPKDKALNEAYRGHFKSCHMKYSLGVPFTQRFFDLAIRGESNRPAGHVGLITANSFMKREFGKKLIEEFIPGWDLTHVIDTSGAYIPGHGTPTVILFARHQRPLDGTIRAVMGIRGEPTTPEDPAGGQVWSSITDLVDRPNSQSDFVSVSDVRRETFAKHPWSIGGGGAAELKERIEEVASSRLGDIVDSIGITSFTLEDDIYLLPPSAARRHGLALTDVRPMVIGDVLRDWSWVPGDVAVFPYDERFTPIATTTDPRLRYLWLGKSCLANNLMFGGKTKVQAGLRWYEFGRLTADKLRTPLSIAFAEVATHNHFVLDRGGKVFKQTAPVIKLPPGATEDDHLALHGLLNSSTACFWLKQVCHNKGLRGEGGGITADKWEQFFQHDGTKLQQFPIPAETPLALSGRLDVLARELAEEMPEAVVRRAVPTRAALDAARRREHELRARMIALQEEIDWLCYRLYALTEADLTCGEPPEVRLGERAFEIVLARKLASRELSTQWFARHGSTPITEVPAHWPEAYRKLVEGRIEAIERNPEIGLIERPEYKRRWNAEPWEDLEARALRGWLLDRLEAPAYWPAVEIQSCARLSERAREDREFLQVAEVYRGRPDFDLTRLVSELVEEECVPALPVLRYKASGLRKRRVWEETWDLQRREDSGSSVPPIPVPPKYSSADFLRTSFWRLRGKLDVPKERFISYPFSESASDPSLPISWAGFSHLDQARALSSRYLHLKDSEGAPPARLLPLLAALSSLLPWLHQYHSSPSPGSDISDASAFLHFLEDESRSHGLPPSSLHDWTPPARSRGRSRRSKPES